MDKIYENFKDQKKLGELNDQSFYNKKMLIQKRIKKINEIKYKYNNSLINILKNSKSNNNLINFSFNKINNSTQNEKNSINLNNIFSYTNSPSKIIDSVNENNDINNNIIINNNNIKILYNKTQSNFNLKKIYVPKFSLKTSNSFFYNKNTFKFKNKLKENNCNSVDNIKRKKCFNLLTERNNSNKNFYQKLKIKYYSGNKILNKNEKILNKIYNSSPELKNKKIFIL